jgi:hypothetical protein
LTRAANLLLLLVICLSGCTAAPPDLHSAVIDQQDLLSGSTAFTQQVGEGLGRIVRMAAISKEVRVNQPYKASQINIYIVDRRQILAASPRMSPMLRTGLSALEDNAIALPPDIVLVDLAFAGKVLSNAVADLVMQLQMQDQDAVHAKILDVLSDYDRIRALRLEKDLTGRDDETWIRVGFANHRVVWPMMTEGLAKAQLGAIFSSALAPVVLHEIGHLVQGSMGHAAELRQDTVKTAAYLANQETRKVEDAADAYALEHLRLYLSKVTAVPANPGMPLQEWVKTDPVPADGDAMQKLLGMSFSYFLLEVQRKSAGPRLEHLAVAASGKYFRDEVLAEALQGFRGFAAEDTLVRLYHKPCDLEGEPAAVIFNDATALVKAERGLYPVFTASEWESLRAKFFSHVSGGTHSHNFYRAARLISLSGSTASDEAVALDRGALFFPALLSNDPGLIEPDFKKRTRIPVERLLRLLNDQLLFEPAINCHRLTCRVGRFKPDPSGDPVSQAFMEVISDSEGFVVFARFVFPLIVVPLREWRSPEQTQQLQRQAVELTTSLRFVANAFGQEPKGPGADLLQQGNAAARRRASDWYNRVIHDPVTYIDRFTRFRASALACDSATETFTGPDGFNVEYRTLSPQHWIGVEITPE